jgi:anthranilate phosphoribosyltransferase
LIRTAIAEAVYRKDISRELARASMDQVLAGQATPAQIAALAIALRMKRETPDEIAGMAEAMRARVPPIRTKRAPLLDTCGTGGDKSGSFNISTTVAIVTASCGVAVAKHGNRAVSSRTGSADVLESLGVKLDITPEKAGRSLDMLGITFLFAPNYHSALRHAAGPRRELGVRTVFNILGPLTNPAGATRQLLGVFADDLVTTVVQVLKELGSERAWVVHGRDGMDELTVFDKTHVAELIDGKIREFEVDPADYGLAHEDRDGISGGTAADNAARVRAIFGGEKGAARDIVVLNTAAALFVAGTVPKIEEGITRAQEALDSGKAAAKLADLAHFRG